jgi:asparagine synthase (glutamine-hydrolysing)
MRWLRLEGISGMFGAVDEPLVKRMVARLSHRGSGRSDILSDGKAILAARSNPRESGVRRPGLARDGDLFAASDSYIFNRDFLRRTIAPKVDPGASDQELMLAMYSAIGTRMFGYIDGAFVVAIVDRGKTILARDEYGMKPLYISVSKRSGSYSSEMKSQILAGGEFVPFPPGNMFIFGEGFKKIEHREVEWSHGNLPKKAPDKFRELLVRSVDACAGERNRFNVLLSGGIDSSVVAGAAAALSSDIRTACVGTANSEDLKMARLVSDHLGTTHKEKVYDEVDMLKTLRKAIYYAESFDFPLIRSCIPNYMAVHLLDDTSRVTLCGEGGDEVFAGYDFLRDIKGNAALRKARADLLTSGHLTGFQRVDRMTSSASLDGRMPMMSAEIIDFGLGLPRKELIGGTISESKLVMRRAFESLLPEKVVWRRKMRFSEGAGSITSLVGFAEKQISDQEFEKERKKLPKGRIRTKEELLYFRTFQDLFPSPSAISAVGFTPRP